MQPKSDAPLTHNLIYGLRKKRRRTKNALLRNRKTPRAATLEAKYQIPHFKYEDTDMASITNPPLKTQGFESVAFTTSKGQTRHCDYLSIAISVEYLPNKQYIGIPVSVNFRDIKLAERALSHIQQQLPSAHLVGHSVEDHTPHFLAELAAINVRDQQLSASLGGVL
jgi:hypothetical protein